MRRRGSDGPGEIEFLPPDRHAFVTSTADAFVDVTGEFDDKFDDDEAPRSPWTTLGAAAGVLAVFAVGIVVAAPWRTDEAAEPAPTTTSVPTTTTAPATTTTDVIRIEVENPPPAPGAGYLAGTIPDGFAITQVHDLSEPSSHGWLELWATPGATRLRGTWLAVHLVNGPPFMVTDGAARVPVGDGIGLLRRMSDGVEALAFSIAENVVVTLTGNGELSLDLPTIAATMGHVGLRPVVSEQAVTGMEQRYAGGTTGNTLDTAWLGSPRAFVQYANDEGRSIVLTSRSPSETDDVLEPFVLAEAPEFSFSGASVVITLNGRDLKAGLLPGAWEMNVVRWQEHDETVTVVGNVPLGDLFEFVDTVEGASDTSWKAATSAAYDASEQTPPEVVEIASGELPDLGSWTVDLDRLGRFAWVETPTSRYSQAFLDTTEPIQVFSTPDATVVIARVDTGGRFVLQVDDGVRETSIGMVPTGALDGARVAAFVTTATGPLTARIVDAGGAELASRQIG